MPALVHRIAFTLRIALKRLAYEGCGRDRWQQPDHVVSALGLAPGMSIADLGSGLGYFTFRFASAAGESGVVYAVDTDADLRQLIAERAQQRGIRNIWTIEASENDPGLREPVDLIFLSNVYHHLPRPRDYFGHVIRCLRPGGRVAILEAKPSGLLRFLGHATPPDEIRTEMEAAGYHLVSTRADLARQSLQVFAPYPGERP